MYGRIQSDLITLCSFEELTHSMRRAVLGDGEPDTEKIAEKLIKTLPEGVYNKVRAKFLNGAYREKLFAALAGRGIKCVTRFDGCYPAMLLNIPDPPDVLFCKGDTRLLESDCLTVVGSRRTPPQALRLCSDTAKALSEHFTLVTGIAEGADAAVLQGALDASGNAISVLAHGLDSVYPQCNARLLKRVEESGLVITEYLPHIQPAPFRFPVRNRILAGLSAGTVVVSAAERSGALITADLAADYGREVMAFPYFAGTPAGAGCNGLIRKGAALVENAADIYAVFGIEYSAVKVKSELTEQEQKLIAALKERGEAFVGELADDMQTPSFRLLPLLSSLEIKGLIVRLGGNRYAAVR